jgi:hypothetical protein
MSTPDDSDIFAAVVKLAVVMACENYPKTWLFLILVAYLWSQQTECQRIPESAQEIENKPKSRRKIAGQDCHGNWNTLGEYVTPECKSAHRSFPTLQSGIFLVGPSLYSPLKIITHTFRKSFRYRRFDTNQQCNFVYASHPDPESFCFLQKRAANNRHIDLRLVT